MGFVCGVACSGRWWRRNPYAMPHLNANFYSFSLLAKRGKEMCAMRYHLKKAIFFCLSILSIGGLLYLIGCYLYDNEKRSHCGPSFCCSHQAVSCRRFTPECMIIILGLASAPLGRPGAGRQRCSTASLPSSRSQQWLGSSSQWWNTPKHPQRLRHKAR